MTEPHILIAGGGIGGMALALTLHQIGVRCTVFEAVPELKPLGVGINLQPNAIRELFDLGFTAEMLDKVGLPALEWALVGRNGNDIHSEPRGLKAGYHWPQYAVHRGELQMMLYRAVLERLGPDAVRTGARVTGYEKTAGGVIASSSDADGSGSGTPPVRLDDVEIVDGTLVYATPDQRERVEKINMTLGAGSLTGPFRAEGYLNARGFDIALNAAVGELFLGK
ncbi:MAG: hypothetical protein EBS68_06650, partial [Rhodobacteraceae bacterium]|nr:hypothetical protein [Paracoccaceae bacterium]